MNSLFDSIYGWVGNTLASLYNGWQYKAIVGVFLLAVEKHAFMFTVFACLVFLDLFSKFIALSAGWLKETGKFCEPTLVDSVRGIGQAHRDGIINSYTMRKQFVSKMGTYMLLVLVASFTDIEIGNSNAAQLVIAYLSSSELLSVVENLDEAGVSAVHDLAALVKKRRNM